LDNKSVSVANAREDEVTSLLLDSMRSEIQVLNKTFDQMQSRVIDLQNKYDDMYQAWSAKAC
jgi:predicted 2-oxoglutarate/Fe(II)-dependent dioxygenase YbiX